MKNKALKKLLIFILASVGIVCTASGCAKGTGVPSDYTVIVTYYLSGGQIESYADMQSLDIYYKPESKIAEPGTSSSQLKAVTLKGYSLEGWYVAETHADGTVVRDTDGVPVASSHKFDFATETVTQNITLVAVFGRTVKVVFDGLHYMAADVTRIYEKDCKVGDWLSKPKFDDHAADGTAIPVEGYYWDKEFTQPVEWPVSYETLNSHVTENDAEGDGYITFHIYTKTSAVTD